jgi:hypothetical protein
MPYEWPARRPERAGQKRDLSVVGNHYDCCRFRKSLVICLLNLILKLRQFATLSGKLTFSERIESGHLTPMQLERVGCHQLMTSLVYLGIVLARAEGPHDKKRSRL